MKAFIILAIAAVGYAAPTADPQLLASGLPAGPLTPALGGLVSTVRGLRPLALEGFSEDLNQDGFVDPLAPVVAAAPWYAGLPLAGLPLAGLPVVAKAAEKVEVVEPKPVVAAAAPIVTYAALPAVAHHIVHQPIATHTYTIPISTKTETIELPSITNTYTLPHVLGAGVPLLGGLPVLAPAKAADAAVAEE